MLLPRTQGSRCRPRERRSVRSLHPIPWSTVVVVAILAVLLLAGKNGTITWSLFSVVMAYLGIETSVLWRRRHNHDPLV